MLANEPEFSDEERQEFVDIINTNTKLLLKLVGDVLELSRICLLYTSPSPRDA